MKRPGYRVFLCYRRGGAAEELIYCIKDRLEVAFGAGSVFLDREKRKDLLATGWLDRHRSDIERCAVLLALLDATWAGAGQEEGGVCWELQVAIDAGVSIVPVHLDRESDLEFVPEKCLRDRLRGNQRVRVRVDAGLPQCREDADRLIEHIRPLLVSDDVGLERWSEFHERWETGHWQEANKVVLDVDIAARHDVPVSPRFKRRFDEIAESARRLANIAEWVEDGDFDAAWSEAQALAQEIDLDRLPTGFGPACEALRLSDSAARRAYPSGPRKCALTIEDLEFYKRELKRLAIRSKNAGGLLPFSKEVEARLDELEMALRVLKMSLGSRPDRWAYPFTWGAEDQGSCAECTLVCQGHWPMAWPLASEAAAPIPEQVVPTSMGLDSVSRLGEGDSDGETYFTRLGEGDSDRETYFRVFDQVWKAMRGKSFDRLAPHYWRTLTKKDEQVAPHFNWHMALSARPWHIKQYVKEFLYSVGEKQAYFQNIRNSLFDGNSPSRLLRFVDDYEWLMQWARNTVTESRNEGEPQSLHGELALGSQHTELFASLPLVAFVSSRPSRRNVRLSDQWFVLVEGIPVYVVGRDLGWHKLRRILVFAQSREAEVFRVRHRRILAHNGQSERVQVDFAQPADTDDELRERMDSSDLCVVLRTPTRQDFRWMPRPWRKALRNRGNGPVLCVRPGPAPAGSPV